jgi:hypothetical protein
LRGKQLTGILTISVLVAAICAAFGVAAFDLSIWTGLLLYSLSGTVATLFVAWRRYRCMEHHEMQKGELAQ